MSRLPVTAVLIASLALGAAACSRNKQLPNRLAPSRMTSIGVNAYLWKAAIDTVSFAPLLQADSNGGGSSPTGMPARPTRVNGSS